MRATRVRGFLLALGYLALSASAAWGQRVPSSVSLNGGEPWTFATTSLGTVVSSAGDPVGVQPGEYFDVSMVVDIQTNGWQWTEVRVGNVGICLDTENFYCEGCDATIGFIVTTIPAGSGTYDLIIRTYGDTRPEEQCGDFVAGTVRLRDAVVVCTGDDCNANGVRDQCDLVNGASQDCNRNQTPDECDLAAGTAADCNGNGKPDSCDIHLSGAADCDSNGVPDECQNDCNENGVADACDVATGFSVDCDGNGVPDDCDAASGAGEDCNGNGVLDICDIIAGTSADIDFDRVPDSCALDCNTNGVPDVLDIRWNTSLDCDSNEIPDECQADMDGDGIVDGCDPCPADAGVTGPPCPSGDAPPAGPGGGSISDSGNADDGDNTDDEVVCASELECFGVTGDEGTLSRQFGNEHCGLLGSIEVAGANPHRRFDWKLFDADAGLSGAPGPDGGTMSGFADESGLGRTFVVATADEAGDFVVTIGITLCPEEIAALGAEPDGWQLYVLDESQIPVVWTPAGSHYLARTLPTGVVGDFGFSVSSDGSVTWWVVRDKLSTFAVGRRSLRADEPDLPVSDDGAISDDSGQEPVPDSSDDDEPPTFQGGGVGQGTPVSAADCGSGMCGATGLVALGLLLAGLLHLRLQSAGRHRRRRCR